MMALPENWSDWEIIGELGHGAYSVVYEAARKDDPSVCCAIKLISVPQDESELDELVADGFTETLSKSFFDEVIRDFTREIKLMEQFKGMQNIVSIEDYKVVPKEDGIGSYIFIRMERLKSLEKYISDKKLSEKEVLQLGVDICTALEFCQERQIIHRDIKPANIFVNDKLGTHVFYKLGDFGIARNLEGKTMGMSAKGTPNYMAPEVAASLPYNATADIYSLGLTMYWLLNGCRLPFFPRTQLYSPAAKREALQKRLSGQIFDQPVDGSPEVSTVLQKACAFKPEDRFHTATELKKALLQILNEKEQPVLFTATKSRTESSKSSQPGKWQKPVAILTAAVVLGFGGWMVFRPQDQQSSDLQQQAEHTADHVNSETETTTGETQIPRETFAAEPSLSPTPAQKKNTDGEEEIQSSIQEQTAVPQGYQNSQGTEAPVAIEETAGDTLTTKEPSEPTEEPFPDWLLDD